MTKEMLLRRISAVQFAMWELHIYLDTHPCCEHALQKYADLNEQRMVLTEQYEERFGPMQPDADSAKWEWVRSPWPWEIDFPGNARCGS